MMKTNTVFGIVGNYDKENIASAVEVLVRKLQTCSAPFIIDSEMIDRIPGIASYLRDSGGRIESGPDVFKGSDILIALGGDGTILRFAREAAKHNAPILGVNLGKLGFLAEVSTEELSECIDEIMRGDYNISTRLTVECSITGRDHDRIFALNDLVIDRGGMLRVIDVEAYIDNDYLITFKGDGLVLSTPTGSTGYALSCGGPIVAPDTEVIIITPISPHTLNARPLIIPAENEIRTVIYSPEPTVQLAADGQFQGRFPTPVELRIRRSDIEVKLIKRKLRSFYEVLRSKLMWGRDVRVDPDKNV
jgi:NAD+ kinase